jgi:hypothetical protein
VTVAAAARARREEAVLFQGRSPWVLAIVLFVSYAYFYQAGGWNQNSRFALVRAILERHTLQIDAYQLHTGDRAYLNGHYYSDKAPGQSLMALPPAAVARVVSRAVGVDPEGFAGLAWISYVAAVSTAGLFTVGAALVVFAITRRWGYSRSAAIFAASAYGLATPAWCYATLFMAHGVTAGCLVLALWLAMEVDGSDARRRRDLAIVIGLASGWAVVSEFQAAVPAAVIVAFALLRATASGAGEFRAFLMRLVAAAALCGVVLAAYNALAFGNPFHLGYQSEQNFEHLQQGLFGITTPRWWRVKELLTGKYRGLLPLSPLVAVAPLGFGVLIADGHRRAPALIAVFTAVYYLLLNASYYYWEGGWAYAPRQLMSAMPFVALGLGPLWDGRRRIVRVVLIAGWLWGAATTGIAEATNPQPPSAIKSPWLELLWPAFRDGDLSLNTQTMVHGTPPGGARPAADVPRAAWNLGEVAGLHGHASLVPLALVWAGGAYLLMRRPDDE